MIKHKYFAYYNGDYDIFDELRKNGFVSREYEYFGKNTNKVCGKVFVASENGRKFFSIVTNRGKHHWGHYDYDNRKFVHSRNSQIFMELTEKGFDYVYSKIVEEAL